MNDYFYRRQVRETLVQWEEKCKEAEKDIQRLKRDIERQETRHFHELRQMRHEQVLSSFTRPSLVA